MRHALVRALVVHFAEAAGLEKMPRVSISPSRFERHMAHRGGLARNHRGDHLRKDLAGIAIKPRGPIYINAVKHGNVADLVDSTAHEVAHLRWPGLHHGALFYRRVEAFKGGYHCTPPGHRLPAAFR